jgi:hypothetical protein
MLRRSLLAALLSAFCLSATALSAHAQAACDAEFDALNAKFDQITEGIRKVSDIGASGSPGYEKRACDAAKLVVTNINELKRLAATAKCRNNKPEFTKNANDLSDSGTQFVKLFCK